MKYSRKDRSRLCATHAYYTYKYITTLQFLHELGEIKKLHSFKNNDNGDQKACEDDPDVPSSSSLP